MCEIDILRSEIIKINQENVVMLIKKRKSRKKS